MEFLRIGSTGPMVELLQSTLRKLGLFNGTIDGIFGNETLNAVRSFQSLSGLNPDGIVGLGTWNVLLPYINGGVIYTVSSGDTVYSIARRFNTSVNRIAYANPDIDPYVIFPCQRLVVPFGNIVPTDISYSSNILNLNVNALKSIYPFLETGVFGVSVLGKPIPYIKLGNGDNEVFYSASIHANEWITSPLLMKFLEDFCLAYVNNGTIFGYRARELFNHSSIYIAPMCNPDGVDLVTGQIRSGDSSYNRAELIAQDYPSIPFPSGWKANINGVILKTFQPFLLKN